MGKKKIRKTFYRISPRGVAFIQSRAIVSHVNKKKKKNYQVPRTRFIIKLDKRPKYFENDDSGTLNDIVPHRILCYEPCIVGNLCRFLTLLSENAGGTISSPNVLKMEQNNSSRLLNAREN